tara:strand:- start:12268 stop:12546 length:279 start_codon:yes stop_codon:yes gene_type:complete
MKTSDETNNKSYEDDEYKETKEKVISEVVFLHFPEAKKLDWEINRPTSSDVTNKYWTQYKHSVVDLGPTVISVYGNCDIKTLEQIKKELEQE